MLVILGIPLGTARRCFGLSFPSCPILCYFQLSSLQGWNELYGNTGTLKGPGAEVAGSQPRGWASGGSLPLEALALGLGAAHQREAGAQTSLGRFCLQAAAVAGLAREGFGQGDTPSSLLPGELKGLQGSSSLTGVGPLLSKQRKVLEHPFPPLRGIRSGSLRCRARCFGARTCPR